MKMFTQFLSQAIISNNDSDSMSFSAVFQSYQDDGRVIMKAFGQWNPILRLIRVPSAAEINLELLHQQPSAQPTEQPCLLIPDFIHGDVITPALYSVALFP